MTESNPPPTAGRVRRTTGIILLVFAALTTIPAAIAGIAEATLVPDLVTPEAFALPALAGWLMSFTWWLHAVLIVTGLALVLTAPRRLSPVVFGGIVAVSWVIAMMFVITSGML